MMALAVEVISLLLGAAMVASSLAYMTAPASTSPWLMPLLVGSGIVVVSLALLASEFVGRRAGMAALNAIPADGTDFSQSTPLIVITWLVLSTGYALIVPLIGFELTTFVFLVIALKLFGRTSWRVILLSAAAVSLVLPLVFRHLFYTLVP
jgi:hypothetical protein